MAIGMTYSPDRNINRDDGRLTSRQCCHLAFSDSPITHSAEGRCLPRRSQTKMKRESRNRETDIWGIVDDAKVPLKSDSSYWISEVIKGGDKLATPLGHWKKCE